MANVAEKHTKALAGYQDNMEKVDHADYRMGTAHNPETVGWPNQVSVSDGTAPVSTRDFAKDSNYEQQNKPTQTRTK